MVDNKIRKVAGILATYGWHVLPLKGKRPLIRGGCRSASTDQSLIASWWRRWPNANLGVATGAISCIIAVDIDGPIGALTWAELTSDYPPIETLEQKTGRLDGGYQLIFKHPGYPVKNGCSGMGQGIGEGIDRRGDGGYIVVPPSIHPDTDQRYRWIRRCRPATIPRGLVDVIIPRKVERKQPYREKTISSETSRYGQAALKNAARKIASLSEGCGCRAVQLYHHSSCVGELVAGGEISEHDAISSMVDAGLRCGLSEGEAKRQVVCGLRDGARCPRKRP